MTLAIEPMVNVGRPGVKVLEDDWTGITRDGSLSAHFEHTVAVTTQGPLVLTLPREERAQASGRVHTHAAVALLITTSLPFTTFKIQHFVPMNERLVVTEADAAHRVVREINGLPAGEEYARVAGVDLRELQPFRFAACPVVVLIDGTNYVRAIQKANPDGSLTFYCAIDTGLVLTVAKGHGLLDNLQQHLEKLRRDVADIKLVLGCDCILRRLELQQKNLVVVAPAALKGAEFIGFSTYGEQYNGIHVNQTLTGLALGG